MHHVTGAGQHNHVTGAGQRDHVTGAGQCDHVTGALYSALFYQGLLPSTSSPFPTALSCLLLGCLILACYTCTTPCCSSSGSVPATDGSHFERKVTLCYKQVVWVDF